MSAARLRNVANLVREWVDDGTAQTIEVLIARRGVIVLHDVFGKLTPAADSPQTPLDAIFPIASITKILTTTAVMSLVDEGRVGLNRPVSAYIPEFKGEGKDAILVRHLLTHTSGLLEEQIEKYAREQQGKITVPPAPPTLHPLVQEYFSYRYGVPLWKPPGSEMSYADFNFDLAAEIVRRVSGNPLDAFAKSRIFTPLEMADTHFCRVDADANRRVRRPPDPLDSELGPPWSEMIAACETERVWAGSSFAVSTASDFAKFGQMFLNGGVYRSARVLSPVSVKEMTRNQIPGIKSSFIDQVFPEAYWGLGWSIHGDKTGLCGALHSPRSFEHWGAGGTYVWVDPELELIGIFFSSAPRSNKLLELLRYWRNDLFTDAVSAAVEIP